MKQRMMPVRKHKSMFTQTNVNNWWCHQSMTVFASSELPLVIHRVDFENTSPIWWVSNTSFDTLENQEKLWHIKTVNYCCYAAGGCLAPYFLFHFEWDVDDDIYRWMHPQPVNHHTTAWRDSSPVVFLVWPRGFPVTVHIGCASS